MADSAERLVIRTAKKLVDARSTEEDWTGLKDSKERRKIQNRLHQRKWRRRKAEARGENPVPQIDKDNDAKNDPISQAFREATAAFIAPAAKVSPIACPAPASASIPTGGSTAELSNLLSQPAPSNLHELMTSNFQTILRRSDTYRSLVRHQHNEYRKPNFLTYLPNIHGQGYFPLAPDYYLLTLIQYNVLRALMSNIVLCTPSESRQAVDCGATTHISLIPPPSSIPPAFYPTALQNTVPHPFWIDSVPWPGMRDNLILALNGQGVKPLDEEALCSDICGGLYEGFDDVENRGILVWGEPWQADGWEMSDGFFRKWSWLVSGCDELLVATNRWRESRGEDRLIVEVS